MPNGGAEIISVTGAPDILQLLKLIARPRVVEEGWRGLGCSGEPRGVGGAAPLGFLQQKQRCRRCIWGHKGTEQPLLWPQETRGKKAKLGGGG